LTLQVTFWYGTVKVKNLSNNINGIGQLFVT